MDGAPRKVIRKKYDGNGGKKEGSKLGITHDKLILIGILCSFVTKVLNFI